jgi:hypothetical protein
MVKSSRPPSNLLAECSILRKVIKRLSSVALYRFEQPEFDSRWGRIFLFAITFRPAVGSIQTGTGEAGVKNCLASIGNRSINAAVRSIFFLMMSQRKGLFFLNYLRTPGLYGKKSSDICALL